MKIGLLHTAPGHVALFDQLIAAGDSTARPVHVVDQSLLEMLQGDGQRTEILHLLSRLLRELAEAGCEKIACTCSSLGAMAEGRVVKGIPVERIDRAAADYLVTRRHVLVLATLASAAESADDLLTDSANSLQSETHWETALVPGAWEAFMDGDRALCDRLIADFANQFAGEHDAVFLSQVSMMSAAYRCRHSNVVTSPETGVKKLLERD